MNPNYIYVIGALVIILGVAIAHNMKVHDDEQEKLDEVNAPKPIIVPVPDYKDYKKPTSTKKAAVKKVAKKGSKKSAK